jgi:hypothetical protein
MPLVLDLCLADKLGLGGLLGAEWRCSFEARSAYSSKAAFNCRASSFRSSLQDFDLCFCPNGSGGKDDVVALCGILGRRDFGERGADGRFALRGTFAE